jgi:DNA-binding transcriptional LysR family regulator
MLDLRAVDTLREVAARGSFSAAAKALHFTQPAVSRRIAQLERQVGMPLLIRSRQGVHLTPAGKLVVEHAEAMRMRLVRMESELAELAGGTRMTARIGAFPTAFFGLVPALVQRLRERAPDAELMLVRCGHDEALARVRRAEIDVALVFARPEIEHEDPDLRIEEISNEPMLVVLPKKHPLARRRKIELGALERDRWIVGAADDPSSLIVAACRAAGFEPQVAFRTDDALATQSLVAAGLGVSMSSPWLAPMLRDDVVLRSLAEPAPRRRISAVAASPTSPTGELLIELARLCRPSVTDRSTPASR